MTSLRVGIVGCSGIAIAPGARSASPLRLPQPHSHAAAYHAVPATSVVAVCDLNPAVLARYTATWGAAATYADYREMLARERLDLLSVVTPDQLHAEVFIAACEAGVRGIFCEKPVATTLTDADRMLAAAARAGTQVLVNHTRRFDPVYRHARWLLAEGVIGEPRFMLGTLGGERALLFRNGTHLIDTMLYLAGQAPVAVTAALDPRDAGYGPVYRGDSAHLTETDPGALGWLTFADGLQAFYHGQKGTLPTFEIELQGEHGRMRLGNQVAELTTLSSIGGLTTQPLPLTTNLTAGMVTAVQELVELVTSDGGRVDDGLASLHAARQTLAVLLGMLRSADAGGVRVPLGEIEPAALAGR